MSLYILVALACIKGPNCFSVPVRHRLQIRHVL